MLVIERNKHQDLSNYSRPGYSKPMTGNIEGMSKPFENLNYSSHSFFLSGFSSRKASNQVN